MFLTFKGRNNGIPSRMRRICTRLRGDYPRRLPDFLVIGATRSGTTTLTRILQSHPQIFVPPIELHYFNNESLYRFDLAGYRELFGGYRGEPHIGEVTPSYCDKGALYDAEGVIRTKREDDSIRRIARAMPDVKLIISLRDPLSRMRSIYLKNFNQYKISSSLQDELLNEDSGRSNLRLISRSQYKEALQHVLAYFPRDNLRVMIFEEWTCDQPTEIRNLFAFLGAEPNVKFNPVASNNAERYRKLSDPRIPDVSLSPEVRRMFIDATAESRAWLEEYLGRKLPWANE